MFQSDVLWGEPLCALFSVNTALLIICTAGQIEPRAAKRPMPQKVGGGFLAQSLDGVLVSVIYMHESISLKYWVFSSIDIHTREGQKVAFVRSQQTSGPENQAQMQPSWAEFPRVGEEGSEEGHVKAARRTLIWVDGRTFYGRQQSHRSSTAAGGCCHQALGLSPSVTG